MATKVKSPSGKTVRPTTNASTVTNKKNATTTTKAKTKKKAKNISPFANFGKEIAFTVSGNKILTFSELKRDGEARWKKHETVGAKPRLQFLGPGDENISLTIVLDARHGVKPRKTIDSIIAYRDAGKADHLVINGKNITANKLVITQSSDTWNEVWNKGELVRATMEITFQEYR